MTEQADKLIYTVESLQGPISEEQANEIRLYAAGRELAHLVDMPGWSVAIRMLADYANDATANLIAMPPGDPRVPNTHAAASALADLYKKFIEDVAAAVEAAKKTPEVLRVAYGRLSPAPIEMS